MSDIILSAREVRHIVAKISRDSSYETVRPFDGVFTGLESLALVEKLKSLPETDVTVSEVEK